MKERPPCETCERLSARLAAIEAVIDEYCLRAPAGLRLVPNVASPEESAAPLALSEEQATGQLRELRKKLREEIAGYGKGADWLYEAWNDVERLREQVRRYEADDLALKRELRELARVIGGNRLGQLLRELARKTEETSTD